LSRYSDATSVHLEQFPAVGDLWVDTDLEATWDKLRQIRSVVTGALEIERAQKRIGSSLEASAVIWIQNTSFMSVGNRHDLAEICITSGATVEAGEPPPGAYTLPEVPGVAVVVSRAQGTKCARSWRITTDVGSDPDYPGLSARDAAAVREIDGMRRA
ncbi:MAG: isoleucine--tRNA ligase, partial [Hyphomicrobium sp.]